MTGKRLGAASHWLSLLPLQESLAAKPAIGMRQLNWSYWSCEDGVLTLLEMLPPQVVLEHYKYLCNMHNG